MKLLLVCTGNICRSPMAEAIARRLLASRGRDDVTVASAGTAAQDGAPASEGAYLIALEHGLDLSAHRARQITTDLVADADLVLGMRDRKSTRLNSSHYGRSRMPSSA